MPLVLAIVAVVAGLWVAVWAGGRRFRARVARDVAALHRGAGPAIGPREVAARVGSLPEPVGRYLRYAVPEGAPPVRTVSLRHEGFFRTKPGQRWFPIHGEQHFTVGSPGFVWNARIRPAPLVWIEARDCLLSGRGEMLVKLNSAFTIAHAAGRETDQSAAVRWLMEAVWFPYAFAGSQVRWEPVDNRRARATLIEAGLPASVVVEVDDGGGIVRLTGDRYRDIGGGKAVLTPWTGRCSEYRDFDGLCVPSWIEGSWVLDDGEFCYVRFRVTALEYNV